MRARDVMLAIVLLVSMTIFGLIVGHVVFSGDGKPCRAYNLLNPAAAQSALQLAKTYPVRLDVMQGFADPPPARSFFDSRSCSVVFAAADRMSWEATKERRPSPGYRYWGGFDTVSGMNPGPYQIVARRGETLRKLTRWDGQGEIQACVYAPNSDQSIDVSPDVPLESGTLIVFC